MEIRIKAKTDVIAQAAAAAAADILVDDAKTKLAHWKDMTADARKVARASYEATFKSYQSTSDTIHDLFASADPNGRLQAVVMTSLLTEMLSRMVEAGVEFDKLQSQLAAAEMNTMQIVVPATVEFSILASPVRMALVGAALGFVIGGLIFLLSTTPRSPKDIGTAL